MPLNSSTAKKQKHVFQRRNKRSQHRSSFPNVFLILVSHLSHGPDIFVPSDHSHGVIVSVQGHSALILSSILGNKMGGFDPIFSKWLVVKCKKKCKKKLRGL